MSDKKVSLPESWEAQSGQNRPRPGQPPARAAIGLKALRPYLIIAAILSVAAGFAAWYLLLRTPAPAARADATGAADGASAAPVASPAPVRTPAASAAPSATATSAPRAEDTTACLKAFFAPDAFAHKEPSFDKVCGDRRPYKGALEVKAQIIAPWNKGVTEAMREWSRLGWYETAMFAALRGRCCADPPAFEPGPALIANCRIEDALADITLAARKREPLDAALAAYGKAARCITFSGGADYYGQGWPPSGNETAAFKTMMARADAR